MAPRNTISVLIDADTAKGKAKVEALEAQLKKTGASARKSVVAAEKKLAAFPDEYAGPDYEFLQRAIDWAQAKLDVLAESQR